MMQKKDIFRFNGFSLDTPVKSINDNEEQSLLYYICDPDTLTPEEEILKKNTYAGLYEALDTLTEREREVLEWRYGLMDGRPHTLEEVGKIYDVTRERIRQIEEKAIRKMRHPVRARKINGYK